MKKVITVAVIFTLAIVLTTCKDDKSLNVFTVDQDIAFGQALSEEIAGNPSEFPVLSEANYPVAYQHIRRIRDNILASGELKYANRFTWEVKIIDADVLNAFAGPGGYMYFYSGIIKFLDNESEFAGVMAHEMAHCDRRHSTDNLTKQYGISIMLGILVGDNPGQLAEIASGWASGLSSLAFSRANEYEADEYAVKYLKGTDYSPCSLGDFFVKMEAQEGNTQRPPVFLSTHPSPEDRLDRINENCAGSSGELFTSRYQEFQNSLP
jgi:beta-barrel assembly-enhancing protease